MIETICIWIMLICAALEFLHMIVEGIVKLVFAARSHWAGKKESSGEVET
jgi:hypothetical protein